MTLIGKRGREIFIFFLVFDVCSTRGREIFIFFLVFLVFEGEMTACTTMAS
jgi:hypothetical protein